MLYRLYHMPSREMNFIEAASTYRAAIEAMKIINSHDLYILVERECLESPFGKFENVDIVYWDDHHEKRTLNVDWRV